MNLASFFGQFACGSQGSRITRFVAVVPFFLLALPVATATASDGKKISAAKTACLSSDYGKGVALLAELYVRSGDINFLFHQGRCFEQNGKYKEAIE